MHARSLIGIGLAVAALGAPAGALAASNPSGTGQPNQDCESIGVQPAGFGTSGFVHATTVYAGAGKSAVHSGSPNAVSQYDVACFQLSQR